MCASSNARLPKDIAFNLCGTWWCLNGASANALRSVHTTLGVVGAAERAHGLEIRLSAAPPDPPQALSAEVAALDAELVRVADEIARVLAG